ncbi:MAG: tetratricopeptide repeat protein [Candidatus Marinimicrobia bacterium]|nr:tetratricopeptide repeat protein [Candidatus Neomarinimicrobiota bacterium]
MPNFSVFIAELRRRRVFRVAVFYGGIAFVIIQIIDGTFEVMGIPAWVSRLLIVLLGAGFPVAMGLAWVFDITDEGIVRTKGLATGKPGTSNRTLIAVAVLAVAFGIWGRWGGAGRNYDPSAIRSIAVLPLDNLGGDPEQVYFVEGMHEALITELAKISALRVISRTSTLGFGAAGASIPEIARALNVDAIVEGSVLVVGDRVRINAQLIDGRRDQHLWAEAYERDLRDVLALHQEVARAIAQQVRATLTPEEEVRLASARQVDPEAYQLYLKAWHFRTNESPENFQKTVDYLEQAVAIDPTLTQAHALLVWGYLLTQLYGFISIEEARTKARAAIDQAVKLDDTLPEVQVNLGLYRFYYERDWAGAEQAFRRAITLNPGYMPAHYEYGLFLGRMGRTEEALVAVQRAKEFDPLSMQGPVGLGIVSLHGRRFDQAVAYFEQALELYPDNGHIIFWLSTALADAGKYEEAVAIYEQLASIDPKAYSANIQTLIATYAQMGRRAEAQTLLDSLRLEDQDLVIDPLYMAEVYSALGKADEALDQLELAFEEGSTLMHYLKTRPLFDPLRGEPRFQALMRRLNFPE